MPFTEAWLEGPQKTNFYTRTYEASPAKGTVVYIHGFIEHVARYEHIFPKWQERGFTVFSYDQRGFGRTATDKDHKSADSQYGKTSTKDQLADIEWAVKYVKDKWPTLPLFIYGHSMVRIAAYCFLEMSRHAYAL